MGLYILKSCLIITWVQHQQILSVKSTVNDMKIHQDFCGSRRPISLYQLSSWLQNFLHFCATCERIPFTDVAPYPDSDVPPSLANSVPQPETETT